MRLKGVIGLVDGMPVIRVPVSRVPAVFGFLITHPCTTIIPVKIADYRAKLTRPVFTALLSRAVSAMMPLFYAAIVMEVMNMYMPIPRRDEGIHIQERPFIISTGLGQANDYTSISVIESITTGPGVLSPDCGGSKVLHFATLSAPPEAQSIPPLLSTL
jgi:hypothetical protein